MRITFFIAILSVTVTYSQIGENYDEVFREIEKNGGVIKKGVSEDGSRYLSYISQLYSEESGTFEGEQFFWFDNIKNDQEPCVGWSMILPTSEIDPFRERLDNQGFYKIDYNRWYDKENFIIYAVDEKEGKCQIHATFKVLDEMDK